MTTASTLSAVKTAPDLPVMTTAAGLSHLLREHPPIESTATVSEVAELFKQEAYKDALSIPVVSDEAPVGIISRYQILDLFINPFGRDLHGRTPVSEFMNTEPLVVDVDQSVKVAAEYIATRMRFPLTEDFIITAEGRYQGMGFVLNLLQTMESEVAHHANQLAGAYRELKSSQAQLVQSAKMASLGEMVAGIAHEMNTPLGYVKNNIEMTYGLFEQSQQLLGTHAKLVSALGEEEPDEQLFNQLLVDIAELSDGFRDEEDFRSIHELFRDTLFGVDQISELVLNLKNFSRVDQARTADVDLNECIDNALLIARNNLKHKAEVIRDFQQLPPFEGAPSQINQVFLNLVNNAAQAIEHDQGRIVIRTFTHEHYNCATVQDNGKGIPEELLEEIFDPFFTTKPIGEGTGLGLSICFRIVKDHGGRIKVDSKPGVGTRFLVAIPRRKRRARPVEPVVNLAEQTNEQ